MGRERERDENKKTLDRQTVHCRNIEFIFSVPDPFVFISIFNNLRYTIYHMIWYKFTMSVCTTVYLLDTSLPLRLSFTEIENTFVFGCNGYNGQRLPQSCIYKYMVCYISYKIHCERDGFFFLLLLLFLFFLSRRNHVQSGFVFAHKSHIRLKKYIKKKFFLSNRYTIHLNI